jgi:hypothetical protein
MADIVRDTIAAELAKVQQIVRTPTAATGYGVDLICTDDLTDRLDETDPDTIESLAQDLYHRITTPRGTLPDDPDYGEDVRAYLSQGMTQRDLLSMAGRIASECEKDDRVVKVEVTVIAPDLKTLNITIRVDPELPNLKPFVLIVVVTSGSALLEAILESA